MSVRVLVSAPYMLPFPDEFRLILESEGIEIVTIPVEERLNENQLLAIIETIDGMICGDDQLTEKVLENGKRLKVISKWGTGIDSIDKVAAERLGIKIYNTPNAFTNPVADSTLGYILCFARQLPWMNQDIRQNLWIKPQGLALHECTLGIIGVGNIGKAVARRAHAFGMKILGNDPILPPKSFIEETGIVFTALSELLERSDFVTIHCDLNSTSFHLIGEQELKIMKPSAHLINTARGSIIEENSLVRALQEKEIAGTALDVFEVEPLPKNSLLRSFENCLFAPHNSNSSPTARQKVHESTVANLLNGLREAECLRQN